MCEEGVPMLFIRLVAHERLEADSEERISFDYF